ncbi:hypothetical protein PIB30_091139 [Stylosanthes scabra]|uniref:Uncharacterized protein n=1 Tax=Stylosanthes scabra TaxID=79078 RepID=A0ABU6XTT9_9FABA|nr:hypothetical protein [Stylosanthes scabra]
MEEDGTFCFKRYRLRQEDDVRLIRNWHNHFSTIILLELYVILVDINGSSVSKACVDTQSSGGVGTNIRRLMVDLNTTPDCSIEGSNLEMDAPMEGMLEEEFESHENSMVGDPSMHSYHINPDSDGDEAEVEPAHFDVEDDEKTNYVTHG